MLSRTSEYALRAAIYLARAGDENTTAQTVAEATQVPEGYMSKVLNTLARAKIVSSQRGPSGGFSLTVAPEHLTMLRVVEAVEPLPKIERCPAEPSDHNRDLCTLHAVLASLVQGVSTTLAGTTIAQLIDDPAASRGLAGPCDAPHPGTRPPTPADRDDRAGPPGVHTAG